jgi:predicted  nucleic acid-binding Zn-ribbon protein
MWPGLDTLLDLQKLDLAIAALEAELAVIPKAVETVLGKQEKARQEFDAAKVKSEGTSKERRAKERELEEAAQNAKKKQARLFEIKTNDEYSAVLKEIEALKAKVSSLETDILEQMEQGDAAAKLLGDAERVFAAAQATCQKERQEKEARMAVLQQELAGLRGARAGQASRVEGELLRVYGRLLKARGAAVVAASDGSCQGCGMALPPQTYNEIRRNDRMFTCPACSRILYFVG